MLKSKLYFRIGSEHWDSNHNVFSLQNSRLLCDPSSPYLSSFDYNMHGYMVSRLKVRGLVNLSMGGCSFAMKFAPSPHSTGTPLDSKHYCIVTLRMSTQIWEMSGVYTKRKRGQMHGAKLVTQFDDHSDVVSGCCWMPSSFSESYEMEKSESAIELELIMRERDREAAQDLSTSLHHAARRNEGDEEEEESEIINRINRHRRRRGEVNSMEERNRMKKVEQVSMPPFFTSGFDKQIRFYKQGQCRSVLTGHNEWVRFMSIDGEGKNLISGCVSSNIVGWDIERMEPLFRIEPAHLATQDEQKNLEGFNSINGLEWSYTSTNVFASGAGDGSVKIWDKRILPSSNSKSSHLSSIMSFKAHDGKLNNLQWFKDERFLMTSGRDDVIRILDVRMASDFIDDRYSFDSSIEFNNIRPSFNHQDTFLTNSSSSDSSSPPSASTNPTISKSRATLKSFKGHTCSGYNIQATLWDSDRRIATGSNDGSLFVYDISSGRLETKLSGPIQPMHLVLPLPENCGFGLLSATAVQPALYAWAPCSTHENTPFADLLSNNDTTSDEAVLDLARRDAMENLIRRFGSQLLVASRTPQGSPITQEIRIAFMTYIRDFLRREGREDLLRTVFADFELAEVENAQQQQQARIVQRNQADMLTPRNPILTRITPHQSSAPAAPHERRSRRRNRSQSENDIRGSGGDDTDDDDDDDDDDDNHRASSSNIENNGSESS